MKFEIHNFREAGLDILALVDPQSDTRVEILPAHGALLHAFKVKHHGATLNLLDSYTNEQDLQENIRDSFKNVKLSPFACRIRNATYTWDGQSYQIENTIAPGKALHGFLYDADFTVTAQHADEEKATVTMSYRYEQADAGYPFSYDCEVTYTLYHQLELQVSTTITNRSAATIPVMDGWHPYFSTGTPVDELELTFASNEMVEFDEQLIPTGKLLPYTAFTAGKKLAGVELDNSFMLDFAKAQPMATLLDPVKNIRIEFYPGAHYPVLQIYIPPHRNSIAIENLSGAPDAFNNGLGLVQLAAGENKVFDARIRIVL
ncbi:aldose 1-epimerase [Chitinophaga nivalis]|uniref:Aldose 1-epimerase n=1 Tax=Chitinophaga nivalis TaxID=2991709 RepID=A0ABT3IFV2_9BACT|nr:aldose 1-epimerase [Chitinophaga nivalis]MCW3467470.1 aldose 1-epimerase [Chitinophaga nivalis]MCW3482838.1 aldose 1-epimerase [Chitinophaga nivalis]